MKSIIFRKESFRAQDGGKSTMKLFIDQVTSIYNSIDVTSYDSNKEDISCRSTGIISRIINWAFVNHYQSVINHNAIEAEEALYTIEYTDGNLPKNTSADLNLQSIRQAISEYPQEHRTIYMMHISGFKHRQIAQKLRLSCETIEERIKYINNRL